MWRTMIKMNRNAKALASSLGICSILALSQLNTNSVETEHRERPVRRNPTNAAVKQTHACSMANEWVPGCGEVMVFSGNANPALAEEIASNLHTTLGKAKIQRFADGEVRVEILESVRGKDVYVVQPIGPPANENIMELLLTVSALRHASAKRVTAVVPYFGYMRSALIQIKNTGGSEDGEDSVCVRSNLAASDIARMIEVAGTQRVVSLDLSGDNEARPEGFFQNVPIVSMHSSDFIAPYLIKELEMDTETVQDDEWIVVSSHVGNISSARCIREQIAKRLGKSIGLGTISSNPVTGKSDFVGKCENRNVLIVDEIVDSGIALSNAIAAVKSNGAKKVYCYGSHALLGSKCFKRLQNADFEKMIVLNTVDIPQDKLDQCDKITTVSVAPILSDMISKMHYERK